MKPGERYFDRNGEYEVVDTIGDNAVRYHYLNSTDVHFADVDLKLRIHQNIQGESHPHDSNLRFVNDPAYAEFIERLISDGWVNVDLPESKLEAFQRRYFALTGTWPSEDHTALDVTNNKWSVSLKISFNAITRAHVPSDLQSRITDLCNGRYVLSYNAFVWELIEYGFRLGMEHRKIKL